MLQADVDDESPQVLGALVETLLGAGALDATLAPIFMKKNRPGTRIEVLCLPDHRERFLRLLLTETSTLGVKARRIERYALPRRFDTVEVNGHSIRVKVAVLDGSDLKAMPEFEDCRRAAQAIGLPVRDVIRLAITAWETTPPAAGEPSSRD